MRARLDRVFRTTRHDEVKYDSHLKLCGLFRQLLLDVLGAEDGLQVHPVALDGHPLIQRLAEKAEAFLPRLHLGVSIKPSFEP